MSATACDRLQTEPLYRENYADIRKNRSAPGGGAPATAAWGRALQYEALKIRRYKGLFVIFALYLRCVLYTSDAADAQLGVDLGVRRIIKKKKIKKQ